eukprot:TRINITY_DN53920_c0_g1_i1.p1 TRINITY_DN53920_c0_g1~~TRINITY_DN53920_c0_g1_i1.p1  ORF type:complete len:521 (-),score=133.39 TRINITY_DN53920_c0_g1_i1:274-1836(-)
MKPILLLFACILAINCMELQLKDGRIRGRDAFNGHQFFGIPFVEKPERFHSAEPPKPWSGTRDATYYRDKCAQYYGYIVTTSEDCLYANVYAPKDFQKKKDLPVMFYIHGGGYDMGSAIEPVLNGTADVMMTEDIIIVTANYRLGPFGFLANDSLRKYTNNNSAGNLGMQDQIMALKWIQRNIETFGGDPNNVTIFGESAGAGSVSIHLLMEESWPMFNKAALESGSMSMWIAHDWQWSNQIYWNLVNAANCNRGNEDDSTECLRTMSSKDLLTAYGKIYGPFGVHIDWAPTVDGVMLKDIPRYLVNEGKMANVPILLGTNKNEGSAFNWRIPRTASDNDINNAISKTLNPQLITPFEKLYPLSNFGGSPWWKYDAIINDVGFACSTRHTARAMAKKNSNVFLYHFTYYSAFLEAQAKRIGKSQGVYHGAERAFVFQYDGELDSDTDRGMAKVMSTYFINFAKHGNPNGHNLLYWPTYGENSGDNHMELNVPSKAWTGLKKEQCDYIDSIMDILPPFHGK